MMGMSSPKKVGLDGDHDTSDSNLCKEVLLDSLLPCVKIGGYSLLYALLFFFLLFYFGLYMVIAELLIFCLFNTNCV